MNHHHHLARTGNRSGAFDHTQRDRVATGIATLINPDGVGRVCAAKSTDGGGRP